MTIGAGASFFLRSELTDALNPVAEATHRLAKALVTVHAERGELILARTGAPRSVMFIATDAVELETAGQKRRLGPGEMFGRIGMLGRRRRTQVRALRHCTLVGLEEVRSGPCSPAAPLCGSPWRTARRSGALISGF